MKPDELVKFTLHSEEKKLKSNGQRHGERKRTSKKIVFWNSTEQTSNTIL